jgi:hypothetical protein
MTVLRLAVAAVLVACALPIFAIALALAVSQMSGCPLQFEGPHVCIVAAQEIGWLLDGLLQFGVWGALTFGLGIYVFAAWVLVELAAIVLGAMRRG